MRLEAVAIVMFDLQKTVIIVSIALNQGRKQ